LLFNILIIEIIIDKSISKYIEKLSKIATIYFNNVLLVNL